MSGAHKSRQDRTLRVKAPAKINLWLEVLGRRPDGYHEIRTVMQTVSLYDDLSFRLRGDGEVVFRAKGEALPAPAENLVVRAARLLQGRLGCAQGVEAQLYKRIPVARGFGGGSSDCAATLKALNRLWGLGLGLPDLSGLAAELGSDVPFFLWGGTALCEGRGERVTPLAVKGTFHYMLVIPAHGLSTRRVYERVDDALTRGGEESSIEVVLHALARGKTCELAAVLHNALQRPAFHASPDTFRIAGMLELVLPAAGCRGYCLSGSGSGFFGIFDTGEQARKASVELKQQAGLIGVAVESVPAMALKH